MACFFRCSKKRNSLHVKTENDSVHLISEVKLSFRQLINSGSKSKFPKRTNSVEGRLD
jgi:hypothetical protein